MKTLRFLSFFGILCAFVFSAQTTYAGSTFTVGDDQFECSNGICQVCEEGKSGDCTNICDSGYWGIGGDMSECTPCATNPGGGFDNTLFGAYTFNRTIGTCYKYCATGSCTDISDSNHSAWSGYGLSGISITPFDSEAGTRTIGFYQFNSNPGDACNTGTDYCPIIMRCSGTSSACKPRTNPVVFKDGDTTLGTLYVVRQTMWSSQNTNFQDDMNVASYSGVVFPIFRAPNAPEKTGYDFIGYYIAQTGGTQVIGADGQLTQSNAALAEAQGTLYAQYREKPETKTYTVQCPSASDPNTMYSIGRGNLVAGETFSIDESNMLKACYHTCGEHQEQSGWDVYLNDSLTPTGTLTGYPITFVAGETYGTANPITLRAHCVDKDFTITYKCGTGTGNGTQNTATFGASYTVLGATSAGCSKENYTLSHWEVSTGGTLPPGVVNPWTHNEDLVLTAEWIGTCNPITFNDNNAAGTDVNSDNPQRKRTGDNTWYDAEPGNVKMCGKAYTLNPRVSVPTNGNAIFRGYFAPNDSTNAIFGTDGYPTEYGDNWTTSSSVRLKALWNCPTGYTWNDITKSCHEDATCSRITFADNNGNTPSINADLKLYRKSDDTTHWYGDDKCSYKSIFSDLHVSVPTWSGYNFAGYYTMSTAGSEIFDESGAENTTSTSNWNVSAPIELQAQWTAASSKVIYKCSTDDTAFTQDNATYGQPYDMLSRPDLCTNPTQQFTKWRAVNDGREYLSEQHIDSWDYTDGTVTFVAQWEQLYLVRCPSRLDQNTMYLLDGLTHNEVGTWTEADMDKVCYKTCGDAQEFTGWDVYLNDSSSPTPPPLTTYPISITAGVTYGTANPITLRARCESVCYMVDFDDTTNGGTSVNNSPFYKIAGQSTWYSDNKCSEIVSDPTVSTPTKENADFIGYDDAISQPGHRIFNSSGGITSTGTSWTISQPTTLYAQYECYEGYHLEGTACVPCDDGEFWNGTSCEACSKGAPGFPKSISPYNWSKYQCYRECSETCQNFNITQPSGYSNVYSIRKFAQNDKQVEFYGNASANDNLNTCSTVTYCPYVVSENSHLPYKVPSVPVSFYSSDNYNTAFDAYHIVGVIGTGANAMLDVSSAFEWSQIVGLGQKLYKNNNIAGQYISTPIFYPVSLAPINEPQGLTFNGYYNPRPATGVNPTAYIGSNRAIGISIAQNVLNGISGNIQDARPLYAQSGNTVYNIIYVMNGGTNYYGAPTSYEYGTGATIDGVPTRNLSEFLGWCTDSALTDCHDEIVIGPEQTGDVTVYASWECVSPYHQNSAGTACEACGDNLYWNGTSCVSCPSSFPHSKQPFNWSEKTCYRECPNNTTLGASGQTCNSSADLYGLNCPINVNFAQFTGSTGKQVEFKGNYDDGTNTCNNADNTYCPRGLFCGGMAEVFKPMTAPVKFYDANEQQVFGTRYIFGSRGGAGTIDLGTGKLWSLLAGSGQKSDVLHNNVGGVMMDYQYTHIIYPTYLAPTASEIPGMAFNGYYYPRTNGTQYVADGYELNSTNAQSVLGGPVGDSNIARKLYANYSNVAYTLTYNCGNGGTGTPPSTVNGIHYGDSITPAANTCSNPGHNFGGWVVSPAGGIQQPGDTFTWQYTNDQVFTANWGDSVVYHINYELYGGTNYAGAPTTYTYETGAVINGVPTRDNSVFNGWCTDAALQNCAMTQTISHETGDKTFYARWKCESGYTLNNNLCNANTITLIYDANVHGVAPTQPSSCEYGSVFMLPAAIVPNPADGYTFNKWTVNGGNFNAGVQIACDYTNLGIYQGTATITATWLADGIIIDWNENGGTELLNGSCVYDGDLTLANAPMYSGYTFNGWLLADGTTYANAASTKLHGCVDTYIGVTSGTSTKITAQWCKNCTQPAHGTCTLVPNMNGTCTYSATCEEGYELSGNGTPTPTCTNGAYAITYRPNGGTPSENITQTIGYLASFVTKDGNTFTKLNNIMTGWTKVSGGNYTALDTQYTYDVTTNTILDAAWDECVCNKGTGVTSCTTSSSNNRCHGVALCDQGYINPVVTCSGTTCESACSRCPSGQISNGNDCEPCPAGTYQFGNECRPCANGYISTEGSTSCEPCENGYSSNADHTACEPNVITIVYANGGHGTAPAQTTCTYNQQFTLPSAMTDNGYTFQNWTVNGKLFNADERIVCNYTNLGVYTETATITGTWGAGKYTVSFDANGGTGGQSANVTATYNQAMPHITSVAPVKVGHTFMGWYDNANYLNGTQYYNANGQSAHVYDKNSDTTLYAGWSTNVITINYSNGGHGTTPNSTTCTYGNSVVLPGAIIADGFTFANWTVAGNTFNANATVVCNIDNLGVDKGTATITAQWNSKTYRVTYNCGMGSGSAPNAQTATYNENFTPATNTCYFAGHTFTGWLVSDTTDIRDANVSFKWMYAENKTLTAQWSAQSYGISYEMNGGTNYAGAPTSYVYGIGTTINGTPTRSNSVFKGWCVVNHSNCAMTQTIGRTDVGDKMFYAKWVCDSSSIPNDDNTACTPCPTGTHVENGQCVENEDFNTCHLPDAVETKRVWNASIGAYGPCMVVTCANDYHLVANTCVKDFRECQLSNGYGTQEWNGTQWGKCIPTLCDSGFEIVGDNCEECSNRRLNGEVVVSTYANGCEIATCMYHGQKYTLDNNECLPICETKSDETGSMVWNESRKKCVRTCNPGYKMW